MKLIRLGIAFVQFTVSIHATHAETINVKISPKVHADAPSYSTISTVTTNTLTQTQMDIVDAIHEFNAHPDEVFRIAQINEGVYSAWVKHGGGVLDNATLLHTFSPSSSPLLLFPSHLRVPTMKGLEENLRDTAKEVFDSTDLNDFKNSRAEKQMSAMVDMGVTAAPFFGPEAALAAGVVKAGYPYVRDELARELQRNKIPLSSVQGRAIVGYAHAMQEIRKHSEIGKAISPYFYQLSSVDPKVNSNTRDSIRLAKAELNSFAAAQSSEEAVKLINGLSDDVKKLGDGIKRIETKLNQPARPKHQAAPTVQAPAQVSTPVAPPKAKYDEDLVFGLRQAEGTMLLSGYLMQIAGDNNGAQFAFGMANMTEKVANLLEKAADMAPMMLAAGYVGIAMGVVSLFQGASKQSSPFPALFQMLQQISKQIDDLRITLTNKLDRMDARFGNLLNQSIMLSEAIQGDTQRIRMQLNTLSNQLNQASQQIREGQFATIEYLLRKEDGECFQYNGDRQPIPVNFQTCKTGYRDRANEFSRSALASANVESRVSSQWNDIDRLFPFGDQYEKLRIALKIPATLDGRPLADPNTWYAATTRFMTLLRNFPENLSSIDLDPQTGTESLDLDPTIETGRSIQDFLQKAAFTDDGKTLNKSSFEKLFATMINNYRVVLHKMRGDLANTGINADITKGTVQGYDRSFDFRFFRGQAVDFCTVNEKKVTPTLAGSKSWYAVNDGGGSGYRYVVPMQPPQNAGFVGFKGIGGEPYYGITIQNTEPRLAAWIQGYGKEHFQPDRSILDIIDPEILLLEQMAPNKTEIKLCISRADFRNLQYVNEQYHGQFTLGYDVTVTYEGVPYFARQLSGTLNFKIPRFEILSSRDRNIDKHELGSLISYTMKEVKGKFSQILNRQDNDEWLKGLKKVEGHVGDVLLLAQKNKRSSVNYAVESQQIEDARRQLITLASVGLNSHLGTVSQFVNMIENSRLLPRVDELVDRVILRGHSVQLENENFEAAIKGFSDYLDKMSAIPNIKPQTSALDVRITQLQFIKDLRMAQWRQQRAKTVAPPQTKKAALKR